MGIIVSICASGPLLEWSSKGNRRSFAGQEPRYNIERSMGSKLLVICCLGA
jgi:hypothetical protein